MKTGKITHIDQGGQWNGLTKYKVTFADGNQYTFFAKGNFKFSIGETINYEVTNEEYRNAKIQLDSYKKENTPAPAIKANYSGSSKDELIIRQTCIKASAEFNAQKGGVDIINVITDAEVLYNWVTQ